MTSQEGGRKASVPARGSVVSYQGSVPSRISAGHLQPATDDEKLTTGQQVVFRLKMPGLLFEGHHTSLNSVTSANHPALQAFVAQIDRELVFAQVLLRG